TSSDYLHRKKCDQSFSMKKTSASLPNLRSVVKTFEKGLTEFKQTRAERRLSVERQHLNIGISTLDRDLDPNEAMKEIFTCPRCSYVINKADIPTLLVKDETGWPRLARLETKYKTHFAKKKKQLLEKINRQLSVVNQAQKNLKKARVQVNRNSYISPQELNKVLSNKLPNAVNTLPESKANINPPLLTNVKPVSTLSQPVKPSEACEVYADYALHGKIGIHCENPLMRGSFDPSETIT
ncbi:34695_t:CDS:2, partial [Gigaspora margarita]